MLIILVAFNLWWAWKGHGHMYWLWPIHQKSQHISQMQEFIPAWNFHMYGNSAIVHLFTWHVTSVFWCVQQVDIASISWQCETTQAGCFFMATVFHTFRVFHGIRLNLAYDVCFTYPAWWQDSVHHLCTCLWMSVIRLKTQSVCCITTNQPGENPLRISTWHFPLRFPSPVAVGGVDAYAIHPLAMTRLRQEAILGWFMYFVLQGRAPVKP